MMALVGPKVLNMATYPRGGVFDTASESTLFATQYLGLERLTFDVNLYSLVHFPCMI
jgi:hypothetical protein